MDDELKPCPFCGKTFDVLGLRDNSTRFKHDSPDCILGDDGQIRILALNHIEVRERLNTRPIEAALTARAEAAETEADRLREALANTQAATLDILQRALAGYMDDYKYIDEHGGKYTRWGSVTQDIAALFTAALARHE